MEQTANDNKSLPLQDMTGEYQDEELQRLHSILYELLGEIKRVCGVLDIPYFIIGGSAMGAFFEESILPWDDDVDVGLTRENYERFMREAPALLREDYFLQNIHTDPHTPYFFSKMMKRGTLFVEEDFAFIPCQKGVFVDIFPLDRASDRKVEERIQRTTGQFLMCALMAKEGWRWKHCGTPLIKHPSDRGFLPCLLTRVCCALFSKRTIYRMLRWVQTWFNKRNTRYWNLVLLPRDHISVESMSRLQEVTFGPLRVTAPSDLETYLRHHYPNLRRHIPKEEQRNHHPMRLDLGEEGQA